MAYREDFQNLTPRTAFMGLIFYLAEESAYCGSRAHGGAKLALWTYTSKNLTPALAGCCNARPLPCQRVDDTALNDGQHAAATASNGCRRRLQRYGISAAPGLNEKSRQLLHLVRVASPL